LNHSSQSKTFRTIIPLIILWTARLDTKEQTCTVLLKTFAGMILFEDYLHTPKLLLNGGLLGEASVSKHETSVSRDENDSDEDQKLFST